MQIEIDQLVDGQRLGWFNVNLLLWSFLAMFADGYDISALAFAAPALAREWNVDPAAFGPAFSASLFGILVGAPLLGYMGDRFGRKPAIIVGCAIYGGCTVAIAMATSLNQIIALRFLTGIGIGGLMPNTIALNSELSPRRYRATLVVLMFTGITLGSGSPSLVAAWLVPDLGWQVLFVLGGMVPLVIAVCLLFALPESVKYLAQFPDRRDTLLAVARRMRPDLSLPDHTRFKIAPPPAAAGGTGLRAIYGSGLALITPLLWLCFGTALMANYFLGSWMPLIFEHNGAAAGEAAMATGLYHLGGTLGGILISVLLDRFGFIVVTVLYVLACPIIAAIGLQGLDFKTVTWLSAAAGVAVLGAQFGNNASAGLLYPTAFRAKGVGWAFAIGRFGSIAGPLLGGMLIAMQLPPQRLFLAAAAPMAAGAVAAMLLAVLCYRRFAGVRLCDAPVDASAAGQAAEDIARR
jgi:AAHS family 4-hydroxybenzoate transporter-like MFS transporter